jgi:hypothetical protein
MKKRGIIIASIIILLMITPVVYSSIKLYPSLIKLGYEPGLTQEYTIYIVPDKEMAMKIYPDFGQLDESTAAQLQNAFSFDKTRLVFTENEMNQEYKMTITLPTELNQGLHEIKIKAEEETGEGGAMVGAFIIVATRLFIENGEELPSQPVRNESDISGANQTQDDGTIDWEERETGFNENLAWFSFPWISIILLAIIVILISIIIAKRHKEKNE